MYVFDMKQVTLYNHQLINEITRDIICNYKLFYVVVLDTCNEQFNLIFSWGQLSQNAFANEIENQQTRLSKSRAPHFTSILESGSI